MSDNPFVHLHVHTEYSLLDGLSRIDKLVNRAKDLNMPALAITDHGTMFGVIDFYRACKAADIKPIIGVETYLARRSMRDRDPKEDKRPYHMLLLAQNEVGYKNLLKIASTSQLEGYYYRPRIDREFLAAHSEGLIASSGCLAAQIPSMVMQGKDDEARELVGWYQEVFGKENFYLELQQHDIPELETLNKWIIEYSKSNHTNVPMIATNDVHYVLDTDYDPHDTLLCIQTGALKTDADRLRMSDPSYHLTSQDEMWRFFGDAAPEALKNTLKVAEMTDLNLDTKGYHLPVFPVPDGFDSGSYLRHLCEKGLRWRYGSHADDLEIRERLSFELDVIHSMGFDTYFLIVWDLCQFARHADIWWNVRGSGAGSVAAYSLGITNIDPIQNNLLFERFLNPGRVSMPDIDMDFPDDRRGDMIDYTARKYGEDKVAAIITFGTMGAKAAVRDVGRALDVPLELVNQAARMIPTEPKPKPVKVYMEENPEFKALYNSNSDIKRIVDTAASLQGVSRHASTHAAGVIVADKPLVEYIPLHRPTKIEKESAEGETENPLKAVTQFPMETCESIGLLKIDFLGLSTLTIMRKACDLVEKHHAIKFTMDNIPYRPTGDPAEDKKLTESFEMIGRGDTVGVFQVEGSGMQQMLRDMRPTKFEHIVAAVSLYRPGPMEFIPAYNRRLRGEEEPEYKHPLLRPILEETFSVIVYQEQIMQIASELFGYELGEADLMRRAVSKKKEKDLKLHRDIFLERGPLNGVDVDSANKIFDDIEFFANYGFNKCVTYDTEIVDVATGRLVKIGDLAAGKVQVEETLTCDLDTMRLKPGKITAVMENGIKPVYRLKTQLGRQIEATANHPFYTYDGWQMLGELSVGQQIAVPRRIPVVGTKNLPNLTSITWSLIEHHFDDLSDSWEDYIPYEELFEVPNEQVSEFISTVWEDRGTVDFGPDSRAFPSAKIARQIHHFLLRLDILSRVSEQPRFGLYAVAIENESLSRFWQLIGRQFEKYHKPGEDRVLSNEFQTLLAERNIQTDFLSVGDSSSTFGGLGSSGSQMAFASGGTDNETDTYWDKIVTIEYIGEQSTYDLTIEGTHNFIANDILVHNSHAADYAVITCQTAYLKAHFPHEYLTALLSTHRDDIAKITTFLGESRRMGIPVLPPDVNYSELDFDIQQQPDGKRGIRSGMAAIKNAGEAALQPIIQARAKGGPFTSLEDFCERVDLRQVQKRTLESLIKVGAMEAFGNRNQLIQSLDRLMSVSSDHHKAKEVGQISMFGESMGGMSDKISLPAIPEVPDRERLNWEKELLGLYVSGRPADKIREDLQLVTTVDILEAKEAGAVVNGKAAVIAGEVVSLRKIPTKNGQMMAVATVEDWHDSAASTEVVLFPRTWDKFADLVQESKVLFFSGKLDTTRGDLQMICEMVKSNWDTVAPEQTSYVSMSVEPPPWAYDDADPFDEETGEISSPPEPPEPEYMTAVAPATQGAAAMRTPALEPRLVAPQVTTMANGAPAWAVESSSDDGIDESLLLTDRPEVTPPRWLMIYFKRGDDADKDRRRLTRLHGILTSYPGEDRFTIMIEDRKQSFKMEFPNHTTSDCEELRRDLLSIVGEGNIEVFDSPQ